MSSNCLESCFPWVILDGSFILQNKNHFGNICRYLHKDVLSKQNFQRSKEIFGVKENKKVIKGGVRISIAQV